MGWGLLTAQVERYSDVIGDLVILYPDHWQEVALDRDKPKACLKPRYDLYAARDAAGEIVVVTLRDESAVVGYFLCFVSRGVHYADCLTAQMDIIYVRPQVRGRHGGVRLIKEMQRELVRRGVDRWFVGEKIGRSSGLGKIFEALGFVAVETTYSLWIGN